MTAWREESQVAYALAGDFTTDKGETRRSNQAAITSLYFVLIFVIPSDLTAAAVEYTVVSDMPFRIICMIKH